MPTDSNRSILRELETGLRGLEARSQRRSLAQIEGVNLCSNDYLGLAEHPALRAAVLEAVESASRVGGTGSRLLSGHLDIWREVEEEFAQFAGTEAALYFGSGYTANVGLLGSLLSKDDVVFSDELNHASLIDGMRVSGAQRAIYAHRDMNGLEAALREHEHEGCRKVVVTESVFSMDGDIAPLSDIVELAERFGAGVIVDEAHATAVHGPAGRGIAARAGLARNLLAVTHTCGKALASAGAFVCGSAVLKEHLINHARTFLFSTAMPPYMAGQIRAALRLASGMDAQRGQLLERAENFAKQLRGNGWDTADSSTQIVPVVTGENRAAMSAAEFLQKEGFAVRAIRPPTVKEGRARLRFSLTAAIAAAELTRLEESLRSWRDRGVLQTAAGRA